MEWMKIIVAYRVPSSYSLWFKRIAFRSVGFVTILGMTFPYPADLYRCVSVVYSVNVIHLTFILVMK
jgi:uncharacterized protein YhhL (DUF1145 family)